MRDFAQINQALAGRIDDLAAALGLGAATARTATGWRYGRRGSMAIRADGRWFCHETATGGDLIGLIHDRRECASMAEAAQFAESFLGGVWHSDPMPPKPVLPPADDTARIRRALQIWGQSVPLAGTLGADYIESRGRGFADLATESDAIRFHPRCPWEREAIPALVSLMTNPTTGEPSGIHRTALDPSGGKIGRKMAGKAGVVRLSPDKQVTVGLGLTEGIETALACMASGWSPIWACLSAGGISRFPVMPYVQSLTIFADHDQAGLSAASACADRWRSAGREARVVVPPREGDDWNDFLGRADHAKS